LQEEVSIDLSEKQINIFTMTNIEILYRWYLGTLGNTTKPFF